MSNWLDVRIKLYSEKDDIKEIHDKFKDFFFKLQRKDPNAAINLGSSENKFVWCAIKSFEEFNSIVGYTKVGLNEGDVCAIIKWVTGHFPKISGFVLQARDDGSKAFQTYSWKHTTSNTLICKRIDPMQYPELTDEQKDAYTEEVSKLLAGALKNACILSTVPIDSFYPADK